MGCGRYGSHLVPISLGLLVVASACGGGGGASPAPGPDGRLTLLLNGEWQVAEGELGETPPATFDHRIPVPSLIHAAEPPFEEIGVPSDRREAFWFRRTFVPSRDGPTAILRLHKAKYGAAVWLNGVWLGDSTNVYGLTEFEASGAVRAREENVLLVRVGADQTRLPPEVPSGWDFEKHRWLPGIWDDVALVLTGEVYVVRVKVEPDLARSLAKVRTTVRSRSGATVTVEVVQQASDWRSGASASASVRAPLTLTPGEESVLTQEVPIDPLRLWSPQDPHLYTMQTTILADGATDDDVETRFGMREVEWRGGDDPAFYLNGERMPLRGSNITLHRFFEDPDAGTRPWDEAWLRTLLVTHPKNLDWNVFRMTLGRAPNLWYDILDEAGILVADEFAFWGVFEDSPPAGWSVDEMEKEFVAWIQESWNHPSIAWWESSNENSLPNIGEVVRRVRDLDPTRQWENGGFRTPLLPDDPIEHHPYLFARPAFLPADFDDEPGTPPYDQGFPTGHPYVANEYGFLWIGPDGLPTPASAEVYQRLLGPGPLDPAEVREAHAYLVGGETEFLRARRGYAGVQHFVYLTHASPEGFLTADPFLDHRELVLEPRWYEYAHNAFSAIGVYIDSWRSSYPPGESPVSVVLSNDTREAHSVTARLLTVLPDGSVATSSAERSLVLEATSAVEITLPLAMPVAPRFVLYAELRPEGEPSVWSRRKIGYQHEGKAIPDPPFE